MSTHWEEEIFDAEASPGNAWEPRRRNWLWPILGFSAWLVFEMTSELWASTLILCAHYAWVPLSTGCWLWWNDPWSHRGRCSLLAFAGHAIGRMVLAGVVIVLFLSPLALRNPAIQHAVIAAAVVYFIGLLLMMILIWLAIFLARIQRVQLWVNSEVHCSNSGEWPPSRTGRENHLHLGFWISSGLVVPALAAGICMPVVLRIGNPGQQQLATITVFLGSYVLVSLFYCWIASDAIARRPSDCWPDNELETSRESQDFR